jgi:elongation factor P
MPKVIASSLRKGNVVDLEGRLYVVLNAQNIHPGKGTPVTQMDLRRISDGVKIAERYRTTEQVERAFVETSEHTFLYGDGEGYHFMNPQTYEQVAVPADVVGEQSVYLQENMACQVSVHEGVAIAIELPQRVVLEITRPSPPCGPDRLLVLQAGRALERRAHHGPAARRRRDPGGDHDRGRLLRGAGEGLARPTTPARISRRRRSRRAGGRAGCSSRR